MKVLALNCSAEKHGDLSSEILEAFLDGMQSQGAEIEFYNVKDLDINPCRGCTDDFSFEFESECRCQDDMNKLYPLFREADIWIFGLSVDFANTPFYLKNLLDRMEPLFQPAYIALDEEAALFPSDKAKNGKIVFVTAYEYEYKEKAEMLENELNSMGMLFSREFAGSVKMLIKSDIPFDNAIREQYKLAGTEFCLRRMLPVPANE